MTTLLLDTTVLIDLSRGNERAADFIEQCKEIEQLLEISAVSAMELVVGCRNKTEVNQAQNLIAEFSKTIGVRVKLKLRGNCCD